MATASQLLPVPAGPRAKVIDVVAHGVDVALLAARLRPDRPAPGGAQDLGGEDLGGALVVADHVDAAPHDAGVELVALLDEDDEVLEEGGDPLGVGTLEGDLVAADLDRDVRERGLDGPQDLIALPEEGGHEVVGGDGDLDLGARQEVVQPLTLVSG